MEYWTHADPPSAATTVQCREFGDLVVGEDEGEVVTELLYLETSKFQKKSLGFSDMERKAKDSSLAKVASSTFKMS